MQIQKITALRLFFIPIHTRMPLKFGHEVLTSVTCARVSLKVTDWQGREAEGWGETPLSVQWVWPSNAPVAERLKFLEAFCIQLADEWVRCGLSGHPLVIGRDFLQEVLPGALKAFNDGRRSAGSSGAERMPHLAALVCNSPFDIALYDAYGKLVGRPAYETYNSNLLPHDLSSFLEPAVDAKMSFRGIWPTQFLRPKPVIELPAWHLVGGVDPLESSDLTGQEPEDGHPVLLGDWITRDGLTCLKIKLRGNDADWDHERLVRVGGIGLKNGVRWFSADFNCTVQHPAYVLDVLDRLQRSQPAVFERILYIEQPFPYDLEAHSIDVHAVAGRKPLFLDESAHDWRLIRLGRELGWNGVALKTCKTQTGAILSACWAQAHGMQLMVQDLTNPMLAQIPHVLLAAHVDTIMGVETNSMQFYPAASEAEARVHAGLYQRRKGMVNLSTIQGHGFGYRLEEIHRPLPAPALELA